MMHRTFFTFGVSYKEHRLMFQNANPENDPNEVPQPENPESQGDAEATADDPQHAKNDRTNRIGQDADSINEGAEEDQEKNDEAKGETVEKKIDDIVKGVDENMKDQVKDALNTIKDIPELKGALNSFLSVLQKNPAQAEQLPDLMSALDTLGMGAAEGIRAITEALNSNTDPTDNKLKDVMHSLSDGARMLAKEIAKQFNRISRAAKKSPERVGAIDQKTQDELKKVAEGELQDITADMSPAQKQLKIGMIQIRFGVSITEKSDNKFDVKPPSTHMDELLHKFMGLVMLLSALKKQVNDVKNGSKKSETGPKNNEAPVSESRKRVDADLKAGKSLEDIKKDRKAKKAALESEITGKGGVNDKLNEAKKNRTGEKDSSKHGALDKKIIDLEEQLKLRREMIKEADEDLKTIEEMENNGEGKTPETKKENDSPKDGTPETEKTNFSTKEGGEAILRSTNYVKFNASEQAWEFDATGSTTYYFHHTESAGWQWKYGGDPEWHSVSKVPADKNKGDATLQANEVPIPGNYYMDLNDNGVIEMRAIIGKLSALKPEPANQPGEDSDKKKVLNPKDKAPETKASNPQDTQKPNPQSPDGNPVDGSEKNVETNARQKGEEYLKSVPGMSWNVQEQAWHYDGDGMSNYLFKHVDGKWQWKFESKPQWYGLDQSPAPNPERSSLNKTVMAATIVGLGVLIEERRHNNGVKVMKEIIGKLAQMSEANTTPQSAPASKAPDTTPGQKSPETTPAEPAPKQKVEVKFETNPEVQNALKTTLDELTFRMNAAVARAESAKSNEGMGWVARNLTPTGRAVMAKNAETVKRETAEAARLKNVIDDLSRGLGNPGSNAREQMAVLNSYRQNEGLPQITINLERSGASTNKAAEGIRSDNAAMKKVEENSFANTIDKVVAWSGEQIAAARNWTTNQWNEFIQNEPLLQQCVDPKTGVLDIAKLGKIIGTEAVNLMTEKATAIKKQGEQWVMDYTDAKIQEARDAVTLPQNFRENLMRMGMEGLTKPGERAPEIELKFNANGDIQQVGTVEFTDRQLFLQQVYGGNLKQYIGESAGSYGVRSYAASLLVAANNPTQWVEGIGAEKGTEYKLIDKDSYAVRSKGDQGNGRTYAGRDALWTVGSKV